MKILVSGATGLVGKDLTELCLKNDVEVNFLTTNKEKLNYLNGAKGFYWSPGDGEIDTNCFEGVTHIVNLAGSPIASRWTASNKKKIRSSRLDSLRTLYKGLESISSHTVSSLVSASAIGIYPHSLTTYYTEEEESLESGFAAQVVKDWESEALKFQNLVSSVAIARIGLVLSDKGGALVKMAQPVKYGVGAAFGSGEQWQSWIHISDLSSMLLHLAATELTGVFNAVAPNPVIQTKLIKEIATVLGRPLLLPNIPKFALHLLLGEMSSILLSSQRVCSKKIEGSGFEFSFQNISNALKDLYQP